MVPDTTQGHLDSGKDSLGRGDKGEPASDTQSMLPEQLALDTAHGSTSRRPSAQVLPRRAHPRTDGPPSAGHQAATPAWECGLMCAHTGRKSYTCVVKDTKDIHRYIFSFT